MQDCDALAAAYRKVRREAELAMLACHRGPAQIGPGYEVSWSNSCSLRPTTRAWGRCVDEEQFLCQVGRKSIAEFQTCYERAKLRAAQTGKPADANKMSLTEAAQSSARTATRLTNDAYEAAVSLNEKYDRARGLLTNPSKFLKDALMQKFRTRLGEFLNPDGELRPERYDDANEVYRYARNVKDAGLELTLKSPIIHKFQQEALDEIVRHFDATLSLLDQTSKELEGFTVRYTSLAPPPPGQASYQQAPVSRTDCSVLKDPARSKQLLDQDQAGWLALVGKCGN